MLYDPSGVDPKPKKTLDKIAGSGFGSNLKKLTCSFQYKIKTNELNKCFDISKLINAKKIEFIGILLGNFYVQTVFESGSAA